MKISYLNNLICVDVMQRHIGICKTCTVIVITINRSVGRNFFKMTDVSIILKAKVIDQRQALNFLSRNPSFLNVSYSWSGMGKFGDTLYCGINKADKTNHRLFEMQHEIVLTQPLSFQALDLAVKDHAKKKNNDLGSDKFRPHIVTNEQVDIGRKGATTAK